MTIAAQSVASLPPRAGGIGEFHDFVRRLDALVTRTSDECQLLREGEELLGRLVACDDWLPDSHAGHDALHYQQYLLHRDPRGRFSVVSFVWGPGQRTPIHDHGVWGLIGVLRGAEIAERYERRGGALRLAGSDRLEAGAVDAVSPAIGDLHRVSNAHRDRVTISIHVYGADIGTIERATYAEDGTSRRFVSGYANAPAIDLSEAAS